MRERERERETEAWCKKKNASGVILTIVHNKIIFFYLALMNSAYLY